MADFNEVQATESIPLPIEVCWEKVSDFGRAIDYVQGLTDLQITTDERSGVGASRVVVSKQSGAMNETITEWNEGKSFTIRLHKGDGPPMPPVLVEASVEYALTSTGAETTDITMTMHYRVGLGPLGRVLNAIMVRRLMQKSMEDVALAITDNYVTDAKVSPERLKELRAAKAAR